MRYFISLIIAFSLSVLPTESKKQHHTIRRVKLTNIRLLPPPAAMPFEKPEDAISFKDSCALIALEHTLDKSETDEDRIAAIKKAWEIADQMCKERESKRLGVSNEK